MTLTAERLILLKAQMLDEPEYTIIFWNELVFDELIRKERRVIKEKAAALYEMAHDLLTAQKNGLN